MSENLNTFFVIPSLDTQQMIDRFLSGDAEAHRVIGQWASVVVRAGQLGQALSPYRDDIVQEVMLEVFANLKAGKFSGRSTLKVYVQRITQNICINWWRRHVRRPEIAGSLNGLLQEPAHPGNDPYQAFQATDRERRWGDAIRQLSPDCRRLLQMVWEERRRYREVAAALNTTEITIKQRVHRCGQRLIDRMKKETG